MKRLLVALAVTAAILVLAVIFITKRASHSSRIAELLPAETVALIHLPDIPRSRDRWTKTALYQIAHEPEVLAFLERPESKIPQRSKIDDRVAQVKRIDPREAFIAVTAITDANVPKVIAGFSYHGKKTDVDALLAELRKTAQRIAPAGKSDIIKSGANEIETFTNGQTTFAASFKEDWFFLTDDLDLMKNTLDRFDGKSPSALRDNVDFRAAVSQMPIDFDALTFVQMQTLADRLVTLISAANPSNSDAHQFDELKKIHAFAGTTKMEGENMRDTMFVLKSDVPKRDTMGEDGMAVTSANTLLYYAALLVKPANFQMPNMAALNALGYAQFIQPLMTSFNAKGLTADDFWTAFGPEISVIADWPAASQIPAPLVALDVHDKAKAQSFLDAVSQTGWTRQDVDGTPFYQFPAGGFAMVQIAPTLAITDKFVLLGLNFDAVKSAVARSRSTDARLDKQAAFTKAADMVKKPTLGFAYIDARTLFERIYGPLRPFAMMWAAFIKGSSDYVDVSKLPATETISKHLGQIVYSARSLDNGVLSESVGPVTMTQAMFGLGIGAGAAAVPLLQKQMAHPNGALMPQTAPSPAMSATGMSPAPAAPPAAPMPPAPPAAPAPAAMPSAQPLVTP